MIVWVSSFPRSGNTFLRIVLHRLYGIRASVELRTMIDRPSDKPGTGSWGHNVLSWLQPSAPHRVLLRYDDLARDPQTSVDRTLTNSRRPSTTTSGPSLTTPKPCTFSVTRAEEPARRGVGRRLASISRGLP